MSTDPICGKTLTGRNAAAAAFHRGRMYLFCSLEHREQFGEDPDGYAAKVPAMALTVGVMASASGLMLPEVCAAARAIGRTIAEREMVLITGAAPGLPSESAVGAQKAGGLSVGVSPGLSLNEHVNVYHSPVDVFDVMIYTGSGLMGREIVNIRSSDIVIIIAGHSGTLGEFAIAYDEGKLIGVLEGSGGVADIVPDLVKAMDKQTGAFIVSDTDPENLVDRLVQAYVTTHFQRPSVFAHDGYAPPG